MKPRFGSTAVVSTLQARHLMPMADRTLPNRKEIAFSRSHVERVHANTSQAEPSRHIELRLQSCRPTRIHSNGDTLHKVTGRRLEGSTSAKSTEPARALRGNGAG